jgi:2-polyprenyl-3-methyl-5-hydroxy-6-metoxy-1,4-benzoquinol methylase
MLLRKVLNVKHDLMNLDRAGKSYWDRRWGNTFSPEIINPYRSGPDNYLDRNFHNFFRGVFSDWETENKKLLEIGCARSTWLAYFAKEFKFKVYGIDYSEIGCKQATQILSNEGVKGDIVCADFFSPPESMIEEFDVVISFGVLEHFEDTQSCLLAFSQFLRREGIMITNIPNLIGLLGLIQKLINRNILEIHVPLSPKDILKVHQKNNLLPVSCDYFLVANFGVLNFENLAGSFIYAWILQSFCWLNRIIWFIEKLIPVKPNRWSSPYINCVAIKP